MSQKIFSFRWDIDHRACLTDGLPIIVDVCKDLGISNTFFVNMGKSTNLREWIGKGLKGSKAKYSDLESINLIQKIGWTRFIYETLRARPVGFSFIPQLQSLASAGHELGLHGGSDHVVWSRRYFEMPEEIIRADVEQTLREYRRYLDEPVGFTSPGFKSDDRILKIVDDLGFRYSGDAIGGLPRPTVVDGEKLGHWTIPVTVCGPRTIPYIEWLSARGQSDEAILSELEQQFEGQEFVVLYGHPCFEGLRSELLRKIFLHVQEMGYEILTHAQITDRLSESAIATA